ncbi:hypothetical protein TIFTF001_035499 [Ficus carica]|uniref:Uncharacterized protein n=1 Tax=Ficus carica TaxID=3494 RepID=A0AA88E1N8_FICCA|nr:hypothetical protein TIFTF001_035499 [Ficus carica]
MNAGSRCLRKLLVALRICNYNELVASAICMGKDIQDFQKSRDARNRTGGPQRNMRRNQNQDQDSGGGINGNNNSSDSGRSGLSAASIICASSLVLFSPSLGSVQSPLQQQFQQSSLRAHGQEKAHGQVFTVTGNSLRARTSNIMVDGMISTPQSLTQVLRIKQRK